MRPLDAGQLQRCYYLAAMAAVRHGASAEAIGYLNKGAQAAIRQGDREMQERMRNALGVALVRSGDFVAAEQAFRDELVLHPESGRALFGLQTALLGQGRDKEAAALSGRLQHAWRGADVGLDVAAM